MNQVNFFDAKRQIEAAGLILDDALVADGRIQRWRVEGEDRERRGWTRLREWISPSGTVYLVGAFGVWHGNDEGYTRIELPRRDSSGESLSVDEIQAIRAAQKELARKNAEERKAESKRAATWAGMVWARCAPATEHEYLTRKRIQPHGTRVLMDGASIQIDGLDDSNRWRLDQADGALVVPMHDARGQIVGLQFVYPKGHRRAGKAAKEFWPSGMAMGGSFGLLGGIAGNGVLLVCEGFATAASLHEATGLPVAYAFSANNLLKAGGEIRHLYKRVRLLFCADDDYLTDGNPGCAEAAKACAHLSDSAWTKPDFTDPETGQDRRAGKKLTDYNDLAVMTGLPIVLANQINRTLDELGWRAPSSVRAVTTQGGGDGGARCSMLTPDEVVQRFSPVWTEDDVVYFDHVARVVVKRQSIANRMPRGAFDIVTTHPEWKLKPEVSLDQVDFDPTERDPGVVYNLWGGWQESPAPPDEFEYAAEPWLDEPPGCTELLTLLRHLCAHETGMARIVFNWIVRWLAYPIQHPGAKMQSCILMHGGQGAGKNTFFDVMLEIYGLEHAVEFGPSQLEKRFNALFSKKLFAIGNEVVASREDLYHVKGHIKHMITERRWVVEAKNKNERWERNCCNFVFLSNEINPQALDRGDRRHLVIWTPPVPDPERDPDAFRVMKDLWDRVHAERRAGAWQAFYHYLRRLPLGDFNESTWPPMTQAKQDLIDLNLDSRERFWEGWVSQVIPLPLVPVSSELLYDAYRAWAAKTGIGRPVALHSLMAFVGKRAGVERRRENITDGYLSRKLTIVYATGALKDPDPGLAVSRAKWLADVLDQFAQALAAYRGGGN